MLLVFLLLVFDDHTDGSPGVSAPRVNNLVQRRDRSGNPLEFTPSFSRRQRLGRARKRRSTLDRWISVVVYSLMKAIDKNHRSQARPHMYTAGLLFSVNSSTKDEDQPKTAVQT